MGESRIHALLIGIDGYLESRRPGFVAPPPLGGSVRDALAAEAFLCRRLEVAATDIELLLAPAGSGEPLDPVRAPSYENMVAAWLRLIDRTRPGDQAFILYSGHGCRVPTLSRDLKGREGLDECLVPYDVASPKARYLRDIEVCALLRKLADKQVFSTVVLDCCHAGGASRSGVAVRGVEHVDRTPRPEQSLVGSAAELERAWQLARPQSRAVRADRSWEDEPSGYVLFAACRLHEQAFEARFDDQPLRGALSHWFFRLLESADPGWSWRRLHERLLARVQARFTAQTPVLEGEAERAIFGGDRLTPPAGIAVVEIAGEAGVRLRLAAGKAHGLREGASFAIVAGGGPAAGTRLGVAEAREVSATCSWAELLEPPATQRVPAEGDRAVLLDPGSLCLRRPVRVIDPEPGDRGSARAKQRGMPELLAGLRECAGPFLEVEGEEELEGFFVWADPRGVLQIGDAAGRPWPGLEPPIRLGDPRALVRLAERLNHLAKWRNVREIENQAAASPLRGKLRVGLGRLPQGYRRGEPLRPKSFRACEAPPTVTAGEWICVVIENAWREALNVTLLDLAPDGSVSQVHPAKALADFSTLEPGRSFKLPLRADLPPGLERGEDVIKVFAARHPLRLDWLELPPLDHQHAAADALRGTATGPLDRLLASLAVDEPAHRSARPPVEVSDDWWVEEAVVRVKAVAVGGSR